MLPPERPPVGADELPPSSEIDAAEAEASAVHAGLDMIRLGKAEQAQVGRASSAAERELDRLYAEASEVAPALLSLLGEPEGAMRDGQRMEAALHIYRGATAGYTDTCRAVLLVAAAALTEQNDRIEDAAAACAADPKLAPARREIIGNVARSIEGDRDQVEGARDARRARALRRDEERKLAVAAARLRLSETSRRAALTSAPLPLPGPEGGTP